MVCKHRKAKIIHGENNPVYSTCLINFIKHNILVLSYIFFKIDMLHYKPCILDRTVLQYLIIWKFTVVEKEGNRAVGFL